MVITNSLVCFSHCIDVESSLMYIGLIETNEGEDMKIKDREEFEDAQAMARIAVERTNNSIPAEAFWNAAMQALISAYGLGK